MKGRFPLGTLTVDGLLRMGLTNQKRKKELTHEGTGRGHKAPLTHSWDYQLYGRL